MDITTQTALANEVRRQAAQAKLENIKGQMKALGEAQQVLASLARDAQEVYASASQEVAALQTGAGPGLTADFGPYSSVDQLLRNERFAGKSASIDAIKTDPTISELDAEASWETAAKAATGLPILLVPVSSYALLYRNNLVRAGFIAEATWEAQRAWIVVTPKEVIMGA